MSNPSKIKAKLIEVYIRSIVDFGFMSAHLLFIYLFIFNLIDLLFCFTYNNKDIVILTRLVMQRLLKMVLLIHKLEHHIMHPLRFGMIYPMITKVIYGLWDVFYMK